MARSLFHVTAESAEVSYLEAGVCAESVADARDLVRARMRFDRHTLVNILTVERIQGRHTWEYGTVLVYGFHDRKAS